MMPSQKAVAVEDNLKVILPLASASPAVGVKKKRPVSVKIKQKPSLKSSPTVKSVN